MGLTNIAISRLILKRKLFLFSLAVLFFYCNVFSQSRNLDYYLQAALNNSPLLKDYNNQLKSASYDSLSARAGLRTLVSLTSQAMYAPAYKNFGYDSAITNGGNYSALINVTQPLFNHKLRNGQYQTIIIANQTLYTSARISEIDLKKSITAQYLTAYADYNQLQFNQTVLQLLKDEEATLKQLVEHGIYLQTDYFNLLVTISAQEITHKQTFIQFKNDLGQLNLLSGIMDTSTVTLEDPNLSIQDTFDLENAPQMLQFRIDSMKNANARLLIDLNYRPKLSVFGDAGFNSVNPKNIPHNFGTSIGVNFTLPIYDGRQRKYQYNKFAITENTRLNYKEFYTAQYKQQILQLNEQLKLTEELIGNIKSQIGDQEKLIELYKVEIDKGLVRFIDFLTVVNNYLSVKNSLTQSEMNRLQIINQMNYLK